MPNQDERILFYLRANPNGLYKEQILKWGLENYITCADRILRRLADEGKVRGVKVPNHKTKLWVYVEHDKNGQGYIL